MELMRASLDKLYRKVYATPGRRVPEEVLREIAIAVSYNDPVVAVPLFLLNCLKNLIVKFDQLNNLGSLKCI